MSSIDHRLTFEQHHNLHQDWITRAMGVSSVCACGCYEHSVRDLMFSADLDY